MKAKAIKPAEINAIGIIDYKNSDIDNIPNNYIKIEENEISDIINHKYNYETKTWDNEVKKDTVEEKETLEQRVEILENTINEIILGGF